MKLFWLAHDLASEVHGDAEVRRSAVARLKALRPNINRREVEKFVSILKL
jgi:hypothetical protein